MGQSMMSTIALLKMQLPVKAHSHRARLRPSTSVARRASTDVDALGVNAQAFSHVFHIGVDARLRPSASVDARLRASTDVDGRRRT